jgi:hypothetical protein
MRARSIARNIKSIFFPKRNAHMNQTMKFRLNLLAVAAIGVLGASLAIGSARAQALPTPLDQEVLVKTTLLTFNDANVTGNYTVLHDKLSKPFHDQFDADKLKTGFKDFADKHVNFAVIAAKPIIPTGDAKIDSEGVLLLDGYFDTTPKKVKYQLKFIRSEGEWKAYAIKVDVN